MTDKTRNLSDTAREAQREAGRTIGAENLRKWRENHPRKHSEAMQEAERFATELLTTIGPNASLTRRASAQIAIVSYKAILLGSKKLDGQRNPDTSSLLEAVSRHIAHLSRALRRLDLDAKPRPRTLADVLGAKVEQNRETDRLKGQFKPESLPESPDLEKNDG